jgi:hypothetical protein
MGHLYSDGKAVDVTADAATTVNFGDLYRIGGWTGFALDSILPADTVRDLALEVSERIWKIKLPAGITPVVGDHLAWDAVGVAFKAGDTNLVIAGAGVLGVAKVLVVKNSNGYAAVQLVTQGTRV